MKKKSINFKSKIMKKFNILMLGMIGILAASCEKDLEPALPQENPQGPIVTINDVVSTPAGVLAGGNNSLTLNNYNTPGAQILIMGPAETTNLPAGSTVSYTIEFSDTESFAKSKTLSATSGETEETADNYYVDAEKWNSTHLYFFGKSPKVKQMYYRVLGYVDLDGGNYLIGDKEKPYIVSGVMNETCFDMGFVIEDHYYLLSNATTWNLEEAGPFAFEHSPYDVYDDPVFEIRFKVAEDQLDDYWKIAPQSAVETGDWSNVVGTETDGDEALSGHLVSENAGAGKLTQAGNYKMTINMEAMTYDIEYLAQPDVLYTPGGANGWNQVNSSYMQLKEGEYYYGVFPIDSSGFKVCAQPNWDNPEANYGAASSDPANSGTFVAGDAGQNIIPETLGLNWLTANFDPVGYYLTTYEFTPITTVGLIGSFAASGWVTDVVMTSDDEGKTWTAETEFKAGDKYKFRFNGGWDINLGGNHDQLTAGGADLTVEEDGTYIVTLNLGSGYPSCTLTKK